MAISTQDGLLAGFNTGQRPPLVKANVTSVAGRLLSLWSAAGQPGVGSTTLGQAAAGAVPTSASTGAVVFTNPTGGASSYVGRIAGIGAAAGLLVGYDILWVWGSGGSGWSVTTTGAQSTTSPAALTRPDANGVGTELWMETLAVGGAASGTSTITYTNSAGTPSRSASLLATKISAPPVGTIEKYALAAGDAGVQSVQSMNNSATWTSGTFRLMIVRRLFEVPIAANTPFLYDAYDLGLPQVYDSACIGLAFEANGTSTGPISASMHIAQG